MKRLISIGGGEPEYDTPKHIVDAMKKAMDDGQTHYGNFRHILELREAVAAKYHKYGVDVDPEHVIITPGSTMGIYMVFKTLMQPGENYITMDPCFFGYYGPTEELGVNAVPVPRYKDENWDFHLSDIQKATNDKTKGILICSPDNPTGSVLRDEKLKEIAEYSIENNVPVISDDIYDELTYDGHKFKSIATLPGMAERTIILNGLSKTYAMTGWRVGYIIAPDQETTLPLRFRADAVVTVEVEGEPSGIYQALLPGGVPLAFSNPIFIDADRDGRWRPPGLPTPRPAVLRSPDRTR